MGTGSLGTDDTNYRLQMTHAWLTHTAEVNDQGLAAPGSRKNTQHGVQGVGGKRFIFYDPGQSILMIPGDWIGTELGKVLPLGDKKGLRVWSVNWLVFLPLNVALVLSAFWILELLGFEKRLAALTSIAWLLATSVLPYTEITWQNHQVLLFAMLSNGLILHSRREGQRAALIGSGAAAAMALLVRSSAFIHLFTAGLFLLVCLRIERIRFPEAARRVGFWLLGAVPIALAGRLFDYVRYGSFLTTGQTMWLKQLNTDPIFSGLPPMPPGYPFINPIHEGVLGVLFSPAKSLFIYDPLLLPCLIVGALAWKRLNPYVRWLSILAVLNLALHIALTSKLDFWHGDWAWAARYHVSSVHLLMLVLLPLFMRRAVAASGAAALALSSLIAIGLLVQLLAVTMPIGVEVATENLQEPVICNPDDWNSKLEFRLGRRVYDLICLETRLQHCPAQVAAVAATKHPECHDVIEQFHRTNHLAFFPFDSDHRILGYRKELALWLLLSTLAVAGTARWCAVLVRDLRVRPAGYGMA